jgi:hypothetical protein
MGFPQWLLRRNAPPPEDPQLAVHRAAHRVTYEQGFRDGVEETLKQLENRSTAAAGGGYEGPVPAQLQDWIDRVRRQVAADRAKQVVGRRRA